jgi:spore maturation protein CgeB
MFYHSLVSDWNHGNAHFLRGLVRALQQLGHSVTVYEPADGWSRANLVADHGPAVVQRYKRAYPSLSSRTYQWPVVDLEAIVDQADLVIVHEWNEAQLVARLGQHRLRSDGFRLLFHDTHHRSVTRPRDMAQYDLHGYDGVLAFGRVIRDIYLARRWAKRAWTFHEAADAQVFRPQPAAEQLGEVIWIGNWGDDERREELREFFLAPVRQLKLRAKAYGVRYPEDALEELADAGVEYGGYLPNHCVAATFSRYAIALHIPRRPYAQSLPGIPTIRPFEAMACGIPLICSPWEDEERLFNAGDYLLARDGADMVHHLQTLLNNPQEAGQQAQRARRTILSRHTCAHRAQQLMHIAAELGLVGRRMVAAPTAEVSPHE